MLELTERDPIDNLTETRRVIAALQGIGVRIAIDDVGTGHSGLSYMLKLGVDIIKIDKMFVDAIGSDRNSKTIVETLIDLAHNMRMDVIAEGVETFEQVTPLARTRHPLGAGLCVRPAAAGQRLPATDRGNRSAAGGGARGQGRRRCTPLHVGAHPLQPRLVLPAEMKGAAKHGRPSLNATREEHRNGSASAPNAAGPRVQLRVSGRHRGADSSTRA